MDEVNTYSTEMIDSELADINFINTSITESQSFIFENFQIENILLERLPTELMELPNMALVRIR